MLNSPCNCGAVEQTVLHIGEGHISGGSGAALGAPQEGDDLGTVAQLEGAEGVGIQTVGDVLLVGPQDGLVEEVALLHIVEGILGGGGLGRTGSTPQEGDDLGTGALAIGVEGGGGSAGGDGFPHSPQNGIVVITVLGDIIERIVRGNMDGNVLSEAAKSMLEKDIYASDIYRLIVKETFGTVITDEFRHRPELI